MSFPPGYLIRAHITLLLMVVIIGIGIAIVGTDASDAQIQAIGGFAFFSMLFVFVLSIRRLDRQRGEQESDRRVSRR